MNRKETNSKRYHIKNNKHESLPTSWDIAGHKTKRKAKKDEAEAKECPCNEEYH